MHAKPIDGLNTGGVEQFYFDFSEETLKDGDVLHLRKLEGGFTEFHHKVGIRLNKLYPS